MTYLVPGAWQPLGRVQRSVVQWFKVLKRTEGRKEGRKEGMVQWSRNKNNSSLTMRSAMQALADSCFHFAFFGALDDDNDNDNDNDHDNDNDKDKDKKGEEGDGNRILRTSKEHHDYEMEKLEMLKRIFLQSPSPNPGNINNNNSTKRGVFPLHRVTKILHCKQHETWDCGLLCIQMIVRWIQIQNVQGTSTDTGTDTDTDNDTDTTYTNFGDTLPLTPEEIQQKHKFIRALDTKSIWTIDLVMLFQNILSGHFDVLTDTDPRTREGTSTATSTATSTVNTNCSYLFCSKHMGVDSAYKGLHYYKTSFRKDARRVKRLFASAHHQHLPLATVAEANLSMDFVLPLISLPNVVAICLIDDHVVRRWGVEPELDCWDGTYVYDPPELMNFAGHYVIVSGVVRVSQVPPGSIIAGRSSDGDCDGADGDGEDTNADVNADADADVNVNEQDAMGGTEHENNARNMHDANPSMYTYTYTDDYCIVMKNPGSPNATEFITVDLFEQAWKAKGTDQDIIFIALHENDDGEDDDDGDGDEDDDDKNHAMNTLHRVA